MECVLTLDCQLPFDRGRIRDHVEPSGSQIHRNQAERRAEDRLSVAQLDGKDRRSRILPVEQKGTLVVDHHRVLRIRDRERVESVCLGADEDELAFGRHRGDLAFDHATPHSLPGGGSVLEHFRIHRIGHVDENEAGIVEQLGRSQQWDTPTIDPDHRPDHIIGLVRLVRRCRRECDSGREQRQRQIALRD